MNMDKFLLESQDSYKSPQIMEEVPEYIRQISSTAFLKDIQDPQVKDALQKLQLQVNARNDPHYDERMIVDNSISASVNKAPAVEIWGPTVGSKLAADNITVGKEFALTPIRSPTTESLQEA